MQKKRGCWEEYDAESQGRFVAWIVVLFIDDKEQLDLENKELGEEARTISNR